MALLYLCGDSVVETWIRENQPSQTVQELAALRLNVRKSFSESLAVVIQQARHAKVEQIVNQVVQDQGLDWRGISTRLGRLTTQPGWGLLILAGVLYALYWFVGVFGASILVGLLEKKLFGEILNPFLTTWAEKNLPFPLLVEFLFGPYGL
jgi:ferrous iron transport protein B